MFYVGESKYLRNLLVNWRGVPSCFPYIVGNPSILAHEPVTFITKALTMFADQITRCSPHNLQPRVSNLLQAVRTSRLK